MSPTRRTVLDQCSSTLYAAAQPQQKRRDSSQTQHSSREVHCGGSFKRRSQKTLSVKALPWYITCGECHCRSGGNSAENLEGRQDESSAIRKLTQGLKRSGRMRQ